MNTTIVRDLCIKYIVIPLLKVLTSRLDHHIKDQSELCAFHLYLHCSVKVPYKRTQL